MGTYLYLAIGFIIGFVFCFILTAAIRHKTIGTLKIYKGDEDGPYMFLDINSAAGYEKLMKQKYVNLYVIHRD